MLLAFAVLFCEAWGYRDAATLTHESVMRYSNLDAHWLRSLCHVVYSPIRVVMETWYRSMWYWRRVHMLLADSWNGLHVTVEAGALRLHMLVFLLWVLPRCGFLLVESWRC